MLPQKIWDRSPGAIANSAWNIWDDRFTYDIWVVEGPLLLGGLELESFPIQHLAGGPEGVLVPYLEAVLVAVLETSPAAAPASAFHLERAFDLAHKD